MTFIPNGSLQQLYSQPQTHLVGQEGPLCGQNVLTCASAVCEQAPGMTALHGMATKPTVLQSRRPKHTAVPASAQLPTVCPAATHKGLKSSKIWEDCGERYFTPAGLDTFNRRQGGTFPIAVR